MFNKGRKFLRREPDVVHQLRVRLQLVNKVLMEETKIAQPVISRRRRERGDYRNGGKEHRNGDRVERWRQSITSGLVKKGKRGSALSKAKVRGASMERDT